MRVEILPDAFTEEGYECLVTLILYFTETRHEWVVDIRHIDFVEEYFRRHAPTRAGIWGDLARKSQVSGFWAPDSSRRPGVQVTRESLADDVHDLGSAARLVLENGAGDGAFVLAIAHVLGAGRVVAAKERGWLKFVQGGGSGEVPKVARNEREDFKRTCRVTFLLDSDRMTPGEPSKHEAAVGELRDAGIFGHILCFREIENYVPNRVLAAASVPEPRNVPLTERIAHLKVLSHEQRAHFDMKKGFADRRGQGYEIRPEQQKLYRSVPESARVGLRLGFGDGLMQVLLREAEAGHLKETDFTALGPDVCDELRAILDLVQRIL
ncbi:hypothetical protein [Actinomadura formosensis]|uniref:hypothetical protein n=1 Tax=Actinomadura formosensis TaxID=60706 RepID=UPI00083221BD|nr:hypothetical protein [Actinomadura formosensis]